MMYKRHRTLNFLDVLFDRLATLEQSERAVLDQQHEERLQEEQDKSASREAKVLTPRTSTSVHQHGPPCHARISACTPRSLLARPSA